jgi:predicted nucleic acid-binding protein
MKPKLVFKAAGELAKKPKGKAKPPSLADRLAADFAATYKVALATQ